MFRLDLGKYSTKGGFLSPTLAAILYQTSLGDFVYSTDASGNAILDNQGTNTSANDGLLYSGRAIELGALNDVDIPIHHTLGADNKKLATSVDAGWTDNLDNTYTGSTVTGDIVGLTTLTSGTFKVTITLSSVTAGDVNGYTTDGTYVFEETLTASLNLTGTGFTGVVTVVSAEQITTENSYLTYYDFTDGLVTLGNSVDGGSSYEFLPNTTFDNSDFWTVGGDFEISGGKLNTTTNIGSTSEISMIPTYNPNKWYVLSFTLSNVNSVTFGLRYVLGNIQISTWKTQPVENTDDIYPNANGYYESIPFQILGGNLQVVWGAGHLGTMSVDSISVKEVLPVSTKYTVNTKTVNNFLTHTTPWSATDWTKINNNPNLVGKLAIETLGATKTIPELDMVMDAGASANSYYMCSEKSGAYLVDSRVAYGTTIVTNGTFDADTDWTKGTGWTIAAGVASCDGTQVADSLLTTSTIPVTVASSTYLVSFEVTAYTAGNVALQFDGVEIIPDKAAVGTYYTIATASDTTGTIDIVADLNFVGSVDNVTAQLISSIPIANYTETIRTNADLQQKGIQTTAFVTDGVVPTAYTSKILNYDSNSYTDTQWNPSLESAFWLEEVIDGVVYQHKYDGVNLTTYTDNIAGTPTAHSPENASYLLGKGVYPKVTADPYISYQSKTFQLYTGILYTSYDQTARYAILSAL